MRIVFDHLTQQLPYHGPLVPLKRVQKTAALLWYPACYLLYGRQPISLRETSIVLTLKVATGRWTGWVRNLRVDGTEQLMATASPKALENRSSLLNLCFGATEATNENIPGQHCYSAHGHGSKRTRSNSRIKKSFILSCTVARREGHAFISASPVHVEI